MQESVYDVLPSPAAGLLQLARLQAGISQQELADRAGVDRSMVSAYEHDRRQPTLPTLSKLLKAAGFELRMHLEPYDDHDDVLAARDRGRSEAERAEWEGRQQDRLAAIDARPRAAFLPELISMNENVDAARIVESLNRHEVDYVIIGGYAAELHQVAGPATHARHRRLSQHRPHQPRAPLLGSH